jgi:ABC-2 type transport system permease protein
MPSPHNNLRRIIRVWASLARASVMADITFRFNFFLGIVRQGLWLLVFVLMIDVIFRNTASLAGWEKSEVLIILALSRFIEGSMHMFVVPNLINLVFEAVPNGTFDFYLTKPLPLQFYTAFRQPSTESIGNVAAGIILLTYAVSLPEISVTASQWLLFGILIALSIIIYYNLLFLTAACVFFLERFQGIWGFWSIFSEPLTVPFDIFPRTPRLAMTYLIPLAFIVFVPAQAATGKISWQYVPTAVGAAIIMILITNIVWRAGLRRYSSASS